MRDQNTVSVNRHFHNSQNKDKALKHLQQKARCRKEQKKPANEPNCLLILLLKKSEKKGKHPPTHKKSKAKQ